jgi:hypothetical protein
LPSRRAGRGPALAACALLALGLAGCAKHPAAAELRLERADLIVIARALRREEPIVRSEVAATKAAWKHVVYGLPPHSGPIARHAILTAGERASAVGVPGIFAEAQASSLTGPAIGLAGQFRGFSVLASRGWQQIAAALAQIEHGTPVAARFARANVALYVESVYDAHYSLALIGKQVVKGWEKLGGVPGFGSSFTKAEMLALAAAYSEPNDRLYPHEKVSLGS